VYAAALLSAFRAEYMSFSFYFLLKDPSQPPREGEEMGTLLLLFFFFYPFFFSPFTGELEGVLF
jgi:hypothetical protein